MDINADLITRTINGDEIAFQSIYNIASGKVYSICLRYSKDITEANLYFEESYVNIYKNLKCYNYQESFKNWVSADAVNTCLFLIKKNNYSNLFTDSLINEEKIIKTYKKNKSKFSLQNQLIIALQNMSVGYRTILNLYYIDQHELSTIGELLGLSLADCRLRLKTAKILFKQQLPDKISNEMLYRNASFNG